MPVKVGLPAPDFTLASDTGDPVTLSSLRGRRVVLYFYPKDDTPGCTTQACGIRDGWERLAPYDVALYGISPDSSTSHASFRDKFELPFPLLADDGHVVAEAYSVWVEKSMGGKKYMGVERSTFLIDEQGGIAAIWPKVDPDEHLDLVIAALAD